MGSFVLPKIVHRFILHRNWSSKVRDLHFSSNNFHVTIVSSSKKGIMISGEFKRTLEESGNG